MSAKSRWLSALAAGLGLISVVMGLPRPASVRGQTLKAEQYPQADWSPTEGRAARAEYVGPTVCAECHFLQAERQRTTLMAHAAAPAAESEVLRAHPKLTFRLAPYSYQIESDGNRSLFTVGDGKQTISEPILYAFGFGSMGQTYVFERHGWYYEGRVSYFSAIQNLDITIGHSTQAPASLEEAMGNRLSPREARLCFGCHTTAALDRSRLDASHLIPGVTCEACHGPGARHVTAMRSGKIETSLIFNPARLGPEELIEFCGACHRTPLQVISQDLHGVQTVRFQPYRLVNSRCWDGADSRIKCISCHDPHQPLGRGPTAYDSKCLACHLSQPGAPRVQDRPGAACPVSPRNCVTCHMPRLDLPGAHAQFTDHYIRVARPGEPYPE